MDKIPLVSFGLPAYKGAHFREALESIKAQTITNFEVMVQDDASPEDLKSIFDDVCANDPRFMYARNEKGTAPDFVKNWDITLRKARGEFFVLASDDDIYEPFFIEHLLSLARKFPNVDIFNGRYNRFNDSGVCGVLAKPAEFETQVECMYAMTCERRYPIAPNVMVRTSALRNIGGFVDLPGATASDYLTWLKLARNGFVSSSNVLLHWRFDGSSVTSCKSSYWVEQKIKAMKLARPIWKELCNSLTPLDDNEKFQVSKIHDLIENRYEDWMIAPLMGNAPIGIFWPFLWGRFRRGRMSWRRLLFVLFKLVVTAGRVRIW